MLLVTLCVSNAEPRTTSPIFVKDSARPFEAKLTKRWMSVNGAVGTLGLYGQQRHIQQLLVSRTTESCRANLKWAYPRVTRGRLTWMMEQLPRWLPFSLEAWRWAISRGGYAQYGPSAHWHDLTWEFPIPKRSVALLETGNAR